MKILGIISGTVLVHGKGALKGLKQQAVENEFGNAEIYLSDTIAFIPRHGGDPKHHILPHLINHKANLKALKDLGVEEIISINSTGSLKKRLKPGTLVVPDDFILPTGGPTVFNTKPAHITPTINKDVRKRWIEAAHDCAIDVVDGGVYWQTTGPRLETRAEVAMIAQFADIVGMTMASEAIIANELEIPYASLCSVDNFAHGLEDKELTMEKILWHASRNAEAIIKIVGRYMERMGT